MVQEAAQGAAKATGVVALRDTKRLGYFLEEMYNKSFDGSRFRGLANIAGEELGKYFWHNRQRNGESVALVPVLTAGMFILPAIANAVQECQVCAVGITRVEEGGQCRPVLYKNNLIGKPADHAVILEPMIATGGSAVQALTLAKEWGAKRLTVLGVLAAPQGLAAIEEAYPNVKIVTGKIAGGLDDNSYIINPGIGDFGDRCCGVRSH